MHLLYFCLFIYALLIWVQAITAEFGLVRVGNGKVASSDQDPTVLRSDSTLLEREPELITNADVHVLQSFVKNMGNGSALITREKGPFAAKMVSTDARAENNSLTIVNDTSDENEVLLENENNTSTVTRNHVQNSSDKGQYTTNFERQTTTATPFGYGEQNPRKRTEMMKSGGRSTTNPLEGMSSSDTKALFSLVKAWKDLTSSHSGTDYRLGNFRGQNAHNMMVNRKPIYHHPIKLAGYPQHIILDKNTDAPNPLVSNAKKETMIQKHLPTSFTSQQKSSQSHNRTEALTRAVEIAITNTTKQLMRFIKLEKQLKQLNISNENMNENILLNTVNTLRKARPLNVERKRDGQDVGNENNTIATASLVNQYRLGTGYNLHEVKVKRKGRKHFEMQRLSRLGQSAIPQRQDQKIQVGAKKQRQAHENMKHQQREDEKSFKQDKTPRKQQQIHHEETKKLLAHRKQLKLSTKTRKQRQKQQTKKYESDYQDIRQLRQHKLGQYQQQIRYVGRNKQEIRQRKVNKTTLQHDSEQGNDKQDKQKLQGRIVTYKNNQERQDEHQQGNQSQPKKEREWDKLEESNEEEKQHDEEQQFSTIRGPTRDGNGPQVQPEEHTGNNKESPQEKPQEQQQHENNESTLPENMEKLNQNANPLTPMENVTNEQRQDDVGQSGHSLGEDEHSNEAARESRIETLKELTASLSQDPFATWVYRQKTFDELGITPSLIKSGIANLGSSKAMQKIFRKAVRGRPVRLLIVGGSISAGGGLWKDWGNTDGVYYKALADWWRKTITPVTRSDLEVNNVAIGGTDSEYFSYCLNNFLTTSPDLVLWELSANDYSRFNERDFDPGLPLEQLTRLILQLPSHPALVYVNFFRGDRKHFDLNEKCPDSEDSEVDILSRYYNIPSLSWRKMVCNLISNYKRTFISRELFSDDGYHPSLLGHAQVAMLLTMYVKGLFQSVLADEMENLKKFSDDDDYDITSEDMSSFQLKIPAFKDPLYPQPRCWTLLTPDFTRAYENTLNDVNVLRGNGFELRNVTAWDVRTDRIQCLLATKSDAVLELSANVPVLDDDKNLPLYDAQTRTLAIATHNHYGGAADVQLDELPSKTSIVTESGTLKQTKVHIISENVRPGVHNLRFHSLSKGFCLTSIMVL